MNFYDFPVFCMVVHPGCLCINVQTIISLFFVWWYTRNASASMFRLWFPCFFCLVVHSGCLCINVQTMISLFFVWWYTRDASASMFRLWFPCFLYDGTPGMPLHQCSDYDFPVFFCMVIHPGCLCINVQTMISFFLYGDTPGMPLHQCSDYDFPVFCLVVHPGCLCINVQTMISLFFFVWWYTRDASASMFRLWFPCFLFGGTPGMPLHHCSDYDFPVFCMMVHPGCLCINVQTMIPLFFVWWYTRDASASMFRLWFPCLFLYGDTLGMPLHQCSDYDFPVFCLVVHPGCLCINVQTMISLFFVWWYTRDASASMFRLWFPCFFLYGDTPGMPLHQCSDYDFPVFRMVVHPGCLCINVQTMISLFFVWWYTRDASASMFRLWFPCFFVWWYTRDASASMFRLWFPCFLFGGTPGMPLHQCSDYDFPVFCLVVHPGCLCIIVQTMISLFFLYGDTPGMPLHQCSDYNFPVFCLVVHPGCLCINVQTMISLFFLYGDTLGMPLHQCSDYDFPVFCMVIHSGCLCINVQTMISLFFVWWYTRDASASMFRLWFPCFLFGGTPGMPLHQCSDYDFPVFFCMVIHPGCLCINVQTMISLFFVWLYTQDASASMFRLWFPCFLYGGTPGMPLHQCSDYDFPVFLYGDTPGMPLHQCSDYDFPVFCLVVHPGCLCINVQTMISLFFVWWYTRDASASLFRLWFPCFFCMVIHSGCLCINVQTMISQFSVWWYTRDASASMFRLWFPCFFLYGDTPGMPLHQCSDYDFPVFCLVVHPGCLCINVQTMISLFFVWWYTRDASASMFRLWFPCFFFVWWYTRDASASMFRLWFPCFSYGCTPRMPLHQCSDYDFPVFCMVVHPGCLCINVQTMISLFFCMVIHPGCLCINVQTMISLFFVWWYTRDASASMFRLWFPCFLFGGTPGMPLHHCSDYDFPVFFVWWYTRDASASMFRL